MNKNIINMNCENDSTEMVMYVSFKIDNETYCIAAENVREIIGIIPIVRVPNADDYLVGMINLRGSVVPVIDVRIKFGITRRDYDSYTVILIVGSGSNYTGLIVDSVSDVVRLTSESIRDYDLADRERGLSPVKSISRNERDILFILDIEKIINPDYRELSENFI